MDVSLKAYSLITVLAWILYKGYRAAFSPTKHLIVITHLLRDEVPRTRYIFRSRVETHVIRKKSIEYDYNAIHTAC